VVAVAEGFIFFMRIECIQHAEFEGPGGIAEWAGLAGHSLCRTLLHEGRPLPEVDSFDMLVVLGGPMSVHDENKYPWLAREKALIRAAIEGGRTVLGICLGAQLIAEAMGARVYPAAEKEIGWFPVRRVTTDGLGAILPEMFTPLHWHGETFDLPAGAVRLAETDAVPNQAFQIGRRTLGLQFHLEATRQSVSQFIRNMGDDVGRGTFEQAPAAILECDRQVAAIRPILISILDQMSESQIGTVARESAHPV
jgi:GMP synthase-like glutamine amidotransferase